MYNPVLVSIVKAPVLSQATTVESILENNPYNGVPAAAKVLSPLKKVVLSLVPVAVSLARETELSGKVKVALDVSNVTPLGTVTVSPEAPSVKLVPDCGSTASTSILLIIRLPKFLLLLLY